MNFIPIHPHLLAPSWLSCFLWGSREQRFDGLFWFCDQGSPPLVGSMQHLTRFRPCLSFRGHILPTTSHQNQKDQLKKSKMKLVGAQPSAYCSLACHLIGERDIHCSICSSLSTAQSMIDTEHVGPDRKLKMRFKSMHFWLESRSNSPGHLRVYYVMSTDTVLPVLMCSWIHTISVAICLTISCKRFYPPKKPFRTEPCNFKVKSLQSYSATCGRSPWFCLEPWVPGR